VVSAFIVRHASSSQLGLRWLPVKGLRYALSLVLFVAAGKLLFAA